MGADRKLSPDATACTGGEHGREPVAGRWLTIVGIGEDGIEGLAPAARRAIEAARVVWGGERHLALAAALIRGTAQAWPRPLHDAFPLIAARAGEPTCVLATGDPFHYGIGPLLVERFGTAAIACHPSPSAFALAASRLGWSLPETVLLTVHGRALIDLVPHLHDGARLIVLSWDERTPAEAARLLTERGFEASKLTVLEALGGPRERIRSAGAGDFGLSDIVPLNTLAIELVAGPEARPIPLTPGLPDEAYESDGQLTKREVRSLTLAALAPCRGERLWDIGLGSGSIAIEWLLADRSLTACGVEEKATRAARARRNAERLGVSRLEVVEGPAPAALAGLAAPDAVFIGGGLGDDGVFDAAWAALRPGGRLVANAVSIESEAILARLFATHGGAMTRIQVSRLEGVGTMHGWRPAMPVTQWRAVKP